MTHWVIPALSSLALTIAQSATPDLSQTDLYTKTVHGCHDVNLSGWTHPAKQVLLEAGATIGKVELCNGDRFPVFTVTVPNDPEGQTDSYFDKLYANLADANGFWSYTLVDTSDDVVITATVEKRTRQVALGYEEFNGPKRTSR